MPGEKETNSLEIRFDQTTTISNYNGGSVIPITGHKLYKRKAKRKSYSKTNKFIHSSSDF